MDRPTGRPVRLVVGVADALRKLIAYRLLQPALELPERVRAFNHLLGECGVSFFARPKVARSLARRFPRSLDGTAFLLLTENTTLRRSLDQWFDAQGIRVQVAAEFEDSALMKVFGEAGTGAFAAPRVIEREVERQYGVRVIGRTEDVRERFYAISVERRIKHPAVVAISEAARARLFTAAPPG